MSVDNIQTVFDQATETEFSEGALWYFTANKQIRNLAKTLRHPIHVVAGVVAALSPNQTWSVNFNAAEKLVAGFNNKLSAADISVAAYGANKIKAWSILSTGSLEFLKGLKVNAFYKNLVSPWSSTSVTIDGHAYSVWVGERHLLKNGGLPRLDMMKRYERIEADYQEVASKAGILPHQAQATTWLTWRRLCGINRPGFEVAA